MKDDIHNTVLVDSKKDKAVLQSLGDIKKALSDNKKGVKVFNKICYNWWLAWEQFSTSVQHASINAKL